MDMKPVKMKLLKIIFSVLYIHSRCNGFILRLPCKTTANFVKVKVDAALIGEVLSTFMQIQLEECQKECLLNEYCKSINYQEDENICELNRKTTEDGTDTAELHRRTGWKFMTTDYRSPKVGDFCNKHSPCSGDDHCSDTCECSLYSCDSCAVNTARPYCIQTWTDCAAVRKAGYKKDGIFLMSPERNPSYHFPVFCDLQSSSEGWIVIQRRIDNTTSFDRNWKAYRNGFGQLNGNSWLGLANIARLTNSAKSSILRIVIKHENEPTKAYFAEYDYFEVLPEYLMYIIRVMDYNARSTARDGLTSSDFPGQSYLFSIDSMMFTTRDRDNDAKIDGNCATASSGGWWYNQCFLANLHGRYPVPGSPHSLEYMTWMPLHHTFGGIIYSEMKIRYH